MYILIDTPTTRYTLIADSIQDAINRCEPGNAREITEGEYKAMNKGLIETKK